MSKAIITTVIPTYRRPRLLRRAITSVLNQTFRDFRICIYDNASGDETAKVVQEFRADPRVQYVCRPFNIGGFANFVDGANRVESPFLSFLSDDDVMLPCFFEKALDGFRRHPEAAMSILATIRMSPSGVAHEVPILRWPEGILPPPLGMLTILRYGNPDLPGLLIRRDVWSKFEGFDKSTDPTCDLDFELQVAARLPIVVSKQLGGILVVHGDSVTGRSCLEWVWPSLQRVSDKLTSDADIPQAAREEANQTLARWLKKGLFTKGVLRSIVCNKWDEAEEAANLFLRHCEWAGMAGIIHPASRMLQKVPGTRAAVRTFLAAITWMRVVRRVDLQWRLRPYSKMLRIPEIVAVRAQI